MKFEEVLPALREGKKVRRKHWNKKNYITVGEDDLIIDENNYAIPFTLNNFEADDWEIVKEKKKVKLRDLTMEQFKKYCSCLTGKYSYGNNCDKCPFHNVSCTSWYDNFWMNHKDLYSDKFLDQEVEIDEEE